MIETMNVMSTSIMEITTSLFGLIFSLMSITAAVGLGLGFIFLIVVAIFGSIGAFIEWYEKENENGK